MPPARNPSSFFRKPVIIKKTVSLISALIEPTFDIEQAIPRLREAVKPFPKAAMFQLADEGFNSLYEQLVSCIISIRTYDEVSIPVSHKLFAQARTPEQMVKLSVEEILELIRDSTFPDNKAEQIHQLSQKILDDFGGELPKEPQALTQFKGVGPKCAHLALGVAEGYPCISVDVHVHRVTNRWGYVATRTPKKTMAALEQKLPQQYWVEINQLLVPFGKHICQGRSPKCWSCPLNDLCNRVGVAPGKARVTH
ncbi:endonuclease III [Oscillatoria sp. CS-180]|uniref:endonuclease III domain-containing protein n=1 Tax=Oscillatoria sp. CS-180 TaxID=3021720 RepID=UPI00232DAAEA|nr:endonuclease III [Oscillatoria sp. CS-180]MDB9526142.1 endonuclease III [Oscillatoria sp. CS-180]